MRLYYQNPGQSVEFEIEGARYELQTSIENDIGDSLDFASELDHIQMGAKVRAVSDSGDVLFIGSVVSIEYSAVGGQRRYNCIAAEALLQYRYAPEIIYPGGVGLTLSDIFSSDAPPQGAGATQYCMGLLWLSRSKICDGIDAGIVSWDSDGVGTLEGWGPLVSGHDIYYGGHLLAASTLSAITGGTYRYAISGGNLYVRGAGTGAIYDAIAADSWTENHVRLGTVATDSEIEAPYNVAETDIWSLIRDLVGETGQYIVFRRDGDYVYLDIAVSTESRGSEDNPLLSLRLGDDFKIRSLKPPKDMPYSCIIGIGAGGENQEGERYGCGSPSPVGRAWAEEKQDIENAIFERVVSSESSYIPGWGEHWRSVQDFASAAGKCAATWSNGYGIAGINITSGRVHQTTDFGETWSETFDTSSGTIQAMSTWPNGYGLMALNNGKIYRTTDYGSNWSLVYTLPTGYGVCLTSWSEGYAVVGTYYPSVTGLIYRTTDYGSNWSLVYTPSPSTHFSTAASWSNGYGIMGSFGANGAIFQTTDYGATWSAVYSPGSTSFNGSATWSNGYGLIGSATSGKIFFTYNYGSNWSEAYDSGGGTIHGIAAFDGGTAIAGNGSILRTDDYGVTWEVAYSPGSSYLYGLATWDEGYAVAIDSDGEIYWSSSITTTHTTETYGVLNRLIKSYNLIQSAHPVDVTMLNDLGLRAGDWCSLDLLYETIIAQVQSLSYETNNIIKASFGAPEMSLQTAFLNREDSDAIISYRDESYHSASLSTDAGSNVSVSRGEFDKVLSPGYGYIYDAVTIGDGIVVAPTYGRRIIKSEDWGHTWKVVFDNISYSPKSSIAKWNNNILIVGASAYTGDFLYSEDAGENWTYKGTASGIIHCIATFPGGIALAGNSSGQIYRSTDYGANWSLVYSTGQSKVTKIKTWSNGYCLASTDSSGNVYRSTDYGANWSLVFSSGVGYCKGLATWGSGSALVCGGSSGANIWRSTDYGANWSLVYSYGSGSSNIVQSIEVDAESRIAFAGASIVGQQRWLLYCDDIDAVTMEWTVSYKDTSDSYPVPGALVVWEGNPIVTLLIYSTPGDIYIFNTDIYIISYLMYIQNSAYTFYDDERKLISLSVNVTDDVCAESSPCTLKLSVNGDIYILRLKPAYGAIATDVDVSTSWNAETNVIRVEIAAKGFGVYEVHVPSGPSDPSTAPPTSMTIKGIEEI